MCLHYPRIVLTPTVMINVIPAIHRARGRTKSVFDAQMLANPMARSCRVSRLGPPPRPSIRAEENRVGGPDKVPSARRHRSPSSLPRVVPENQCRAVARTGRYSFSGCLKAAGCWAQPSPPVSWRRSRRWRADLRWRANCAPEVKLIVASPRVIHRT